MFLPAVLSFLILWLLHQFWWRRRAFPPGPMPLPFIGNFHQRFWIDLANPQLSMLEFREKYGTMFTVWLPKPMIVLADHEILYDALVWQGDTFAGRPDSSLYRMFTGHHPDGDGIILSEKDRWHVQRQFALRTFRHFGMGQNLMEEKIHVHAEQLIDHIRRRIEEGDRMSVSMNVHHSLAFCIGNIIHDVVMGRTYAYGDAEFEKFKGLIDAVLKQVASVQMMMYDCYSWMSNFLPLYKVYRKNGFELQQFFLHEIDRHEQEFVKDGEPSDFIEAYLQEMQIQPDNPHFNKLTLAINSGDLWTGGMETTVTSLRWAVIYLLYYPSIQRKLQMEIDEVLLGERVCFGDRNRLHYVMATINELLRIINVLPWHIPHRVIRDTTLAGVLLPAGTDVMPQFGAVHFDPKLFPEPFKFRPERFLDAEGRFKPHPKFSPFGLGKRSCLGERLARVELLVLFVTILQNFEFKPIEGEPLPKLDRTMGMTTVPNEFECEVKKRVVMQNNPYIYQI